MGQGSHIIDELFPFQLHLLLMSYYSGNKQIFVFIQQSSGLGGEKKKALLCFQSWNNQESNKLACKYLPPISVLLKQADTYSFKAGVWRKKKELSQESWFLLEAT